jgi:hypothetical protein
MLGETDDPRASAAPQRIECTAKSQKFEIAADKEPSSVELDPNVWVLMESKFTRR